VLPLLVMSKRMHSIFMLRCFNDCFAVMGLFAAIFCFQRNQWHLGSFFYTTGLNVKMSLLLPLPAMGVLMVQALGGREAMTQAMIIFQVSVSYWRCPKSRAIGLMVGRFFTAIRSGNNHSPTLEEPLNSAGHSCTSGPSTGALFLKRLSPPSRSHSDSWLLTWAF
jgi:hypothetical protein